MKRWGTTPVAGGLGEMGGGWTVEDRKIALYPSFFFIIFIFLAVPRSLWDLSSPTRDGTHVLCSGSVEC